MEMMKEVYNDTYMRISINEDARMLNYKIMGYPKFSEVIHKGHDKLYEILKKSKGKKISIPCRMLL